jgi:hypothetical protein
MDLAADALVAAIKTKAVSDVALSDKQRIS